MELGKEMCLSEWSPADQTANQSIISDLVFLDLYRQYIDLTAAPQPLPPSTCCRFPLISQQEIGSSNVNVQRGDEL